MDILRVENLCKVYGKGDTAVRALDNVSFTIQKGDFVAIVGPSGSGKSTLLHILGGVDTPSSGKVYIDNTDVYSLSETNLAIFRRRQIGLIYQFFNLVPVLNVEENITLPLLLDGRKVDKAFLNDLTGTLGLRERLRHLPNQLSGGMRQRCALIRTLATSPDVLLLDEPFSALDYQTRLAVSGDIAQIIRREHKTALLVTHDISEAISLSDRIVVLTHRPATVKAIHDLGALRAVPSLQRRSRAEFQTLFNQIWEELDVNA